MQDKWVVNEYGSIAPDWLDESAAILFEDGYMMESRRVFFYQTFRDHGIYNLSDFLKMKNATGQSMKNKIRVTWKNGKAVVRKQTNAPLTTSRNIQQRQGQKNVSAITFKPTLFYAQSRVFTDYLIARSGKPCILANIGRYLGEKYNFEDWLKQQVLFPEINTIENLEADFLGWARTQMDKYPKMEEWTTKQWVKPSAIEKP